MYVIKGLRISILLFLFLLAACSTPAHQDTRFTSYDTETILVRVYSSDTYELDGFMVNGQVLALQIKSLAENRVVKNLLIESKGPTSLADQVTAIQIGEDNGLITYRSGLFGPVKISSKELLAQQLRKDEAEPPVLYESRHRRVKSNQDKKH